MTRRRRNWIFLFASAAAGFGAIIVCPFLTLMIVGLFATFLFGSRPAADNYEWLTLIFLLIGLAIGFLVGPAVYFVVSRPAQRRSPYHWWRLVRVYLVATIPIALFYVVSFWGFPRLPWSWWDVAAISWIVMVPLVYWLPDLYRREMPRFRTGFYRRARWVRRNAAPIWLNAFFAALLFVGFAVLTVYILDQVLQTPASLSRLGLINERAQLIVVLALSLVIPYLASRFVFSLITWRLTDDAAGYPSSGSDLSASRSG